MLVLSRRLNEKILFPGINATVEVVSSKGGVFRVGINAPPEVTVLREEIAHGQVSTANPQTVPTQQNLNRLLDQLRDRLRLNSSGLGMVQLLLDTGNLVDARQLLTRLHDDLQLLCRGVEGERSEAPSQQRAPVRKPRKALLVEDDLYQRELLAGLLRMAGLEVDTAGDGSDALDYLRSRGRPDVVLMDMGLPRCDGATAVRHIRQDPAYSGLRIYAVTGSAPDEFELPQGPGGIDRWFRKPLNPSMLLHDLEQELKSNPCPV